MSINSDQYEVGRQFAAEILNVSVRTLDRYTKKKKISSVRRGRQLFFSEEELLNFKGQLLAKEMGKQRAAQKKQSTAKGHVFNAPRQDDFVDVQKAQAREQSSVVESNHVSNEQPESAMSTEEHFEQVVYKKLYEESEVDNKELRKKVEGANYRIGQLEAQVNSMIPMVEYKKQKDELLLLAEENQFKQEDIKRLESNLKIEQFAKKIYAGLLWGMLCLIPILLIIRVIG